MNGKDMVKLRRKKLRRRSPVLPLPLKRDVNQAMEEKSISNYRQLVLASRQSMSVYPFRWEPGYGCTQYNPELMPVMAFGILAEGKSIHSVMAEFGIMEEKLRKWMEKFPEFKQAVEIGYLVGYEWWLEIGRNNLCNNRFNNSLYECQMRNRYKWLERIGGSVANVQNNLQVVQGILGNGEAIQEKRIRLQDLSTEQLEKLKSVLITAEAV